MTYHEVGHSPYGLSPENFSLQMQFLAHHAKVLSVAELVANRRAHQQSPLVCALTFDDGYAGVHENALPILKEYGFSATVYLTTGAIHELENTRSDLYEGLDPGQWMLSWQQVRHLAEGGLTIGSHLCQHVDLSRLSREEARRQLTLSRQVIESRVGRPCIHLAYPWGRFSLRNIEWVRLAGYTSAVTVIHRGLPKRCDLFRIPRLYVDRDCTIEDFQALVRGDWDYLSIAQILRRPLTRSSIISSRVSAPTHIA